MGKRKKRSNLCHLWGPVGLVVVLCFGYPAQAQEVSTQVTIEKVTRESAKGLDCVTLGITGTVSTLDGSAAIEGALCTASYQNDDGVGDILYFDHNSYAPGPFPQNPNGGTVSHALTDAFGGFVLRVDVCPNDVFWDADFLICASKEGFQEQCLTANFDQGENNQQRFFNLPAGTGSTPTPSPTVPVPTSTPTIQLPTATPTNTSIGFAAHPEFDADGNGIIGPGDLLLFLADWYKPVPPK